ncbi:MAG TPA: SIS domain-containing protein [Solirubrobacteraceae bacterium]|jgi:D-sedoheptulose 7-phosphate isomerase|nr:SIS domain-containing protein [Solirubrobacteraceae bacterium]
MPAVALAAAERRRVAGEEFFAREAERIARLCHRMAERFARGGRLVAFGDGPLARSDARHVAVEFVHPVIVGKRALPALALTAEGGPVDGQVQLLVEPQDIALAFGEHPKTVAALRIARERGCLTLAVAHVGAEWELVPEEDDPFVAQELVETLYHVLWELVHVFFEHRGLLEGRTERTVHDTGASSFLYPFLAQREDDLDAVVADVRASVLAKAAEVAALRAQTLGEGELPLRDAARAMRARLDAGGRVLALGNGGSATDAMDAVADLRAPPAGWPARAAIDLTEDPGILTAIANDVGEESIFSRQIIAHGRAQDTLLAFSTSGGSRNVLAALVEARRRGMLTIALVGYDGGRIAAEGLADHVIVTRSEHIPRIQEAQASAWHVLRELVELGAQGPPAPAADHPPAPAADHPLYGMVLSEIRQRRRE